MGRLESESQPVSQNGRSRPELDEEGIPTSSVGDNAPLGLL